MKREKRKGPRLFIPGEGTRAGVYPLDLDDVSWRVLWGLQEKLKENKHLAAAVSDPELYAPETGQEVFNIWMQTLTELQEALGLEVDG